MSTTTTMKKTATKRTLLVGLAATLGFVTFTENAQAQEILLTGPLAGAPAVRKLRLYRKGRFEISPTASFSILDEFKRNILFGGQLTYNITDWLGLGVYGTFGAVKLNLGLPKKIQVVNAQRRLPVEEGGSPETSADRRLTAWNIGPDFTQQLASYNYVLAPQLTVVPFRGKIALFSSVYADTEIFFFAGPAFVGLTERADCTGPGQPETACVSNFQTASRMAIAPTFGLGWTFFVNKWNSLGLEYRALPFSWNTGGIDTAGGGRDEAFPDYKIDSADRQFKFNMLLSVRWNFYLPISLQTSE
jgi:hypothetical protein